MKNYIGFKMVEAEPMTLTEYNKEGRHLVYSGDSEEGYKVNYQDGYISWSPKDIFEQAYMQVGDDNTINQRNVDAFISAYEDYKLGDKTTVVRGILANGFVVVESSSCVDPRNFDQALGIDICMGRIRNKVWELLGFLLQTAKNGVR